MEFKECEAVEMAPPMLGLGWLKGKLEVLADQLLIAASRKSPDDIADVMDVAIRIMSGEIIAELKIPMESSVAQIKNELAKVDQTKTEAGRLKLFLEDKDLNVLSRETTLKELCEDDQQKITLQLIRLSGYQIQKMSDSLGKMKYSEYVLSKFVITGDSGTGKTNLMTRFVNDTFTDEFVSTVGIDFLLQTLVVDENTCVKCQIADNAGVERYRLRTMTPYYRGAQAIMVVCDVTNHDSFDNLSLWLDLIRRYADEDVALCIVANKVDLEDQRQVSHEELTAFAATHCIQYFEVSAKTDDNVDEPFYYLTGTILDKRRALEEEEDDDDSY